MLKIKDGALYAQTKTVSAVIRDGAILSLKSIKTGTEFIRNTDTVAMELVYALDRSVPVEIGHGGSVEWAQVNEHTVEMRLLGWMANAVVIFSEDIENGDLLIAPSAYTAMRGVRSLRWSVMGIDPGLDVVAPLFQGVKLRLDDPILWHTRSPWPREWEAGFNIFQGDHEGFWVWTQDTQYRYKSIKFGSETDPYRVGFERPTGRFTRTSRQVVLPGGSVFLKATGTCPRRSTRRGWNKPGSLISGAPSNRTGSTI